MSDKPQLKRWRVLLCDDREELITATVMDCPSDGSLTFWTEASCVARFSNWVGAVLAEEALQFPKLPASGILEAVIISGQRYDVGASGEFDS